MDKTTRGSKVKEYVIEKVSGNKFQDPGHNLEHILRVYAVGVSIGLKESANLEILEPALLLHDIVRPSDPKLEKEHAALSADHAKRILPSFNYSLKEINLITHGILAHSMSSRYEEPKTLEAKIVYDADKQDGLGEDGVERAKKFGEARGYSVEQTARWYLGRLIDGAKHKPIFYTQAGKELGSKKLQESLDFCRKVLGRECEETLHRELGILDIKNIQL